MLRKVPLIVILGSTGTGKTKLSIELAQKFGGEIISADSMQLYQNLDIVTAKATKEEQQTIKHHLLDIANPGKAFTVVDFRDAAIPVIDHLLSRQKCPIIVGGTNYYIESLLWKVLVNVSPNLTENNKRKLDNNHLDAVDGKRSCSTTSSSPTIADNLTYNDLEGLDSDRLHNILFSIDPLSANRLHPNNRRKVLRALEVYMKSGKPLSDFIIEQQNEPGGSKLGGPLRYEHVILFWLRSNQTVLNERLDKRIDGMLAQGLLPEIRSFYDSMTNFNDCTKGILQTIGFKELLPYLKAYDKHHDNLVDKYIKQKPVDNEDDNDVERPIGMDLLEKCLAELCLVTKRYSRKQIKWVQHRLLDSVNRNVPPIYGLDTSNPGNWLNDVYLPAENVVQSYIENVEPVLLKPLEPNVNPRAHLNENVTNFCEICDRRFIGEYQWDIHMKSSRHQKRLYKKKKNEIVKDSSSNVI